MTKKWTEKDLQGRPGIKKVEYMCEGKHQSKGDKYPIIPISTNENLFIIRRKVPGLNGKDGLIREHWTDRKTRLKNLSLILWEQHKGRHDGPVQVIFTRYTCQLMDWDNHCASFKLLGDALVDIGVIEDDKPDIIKIFDPRQEKVDTRKEERIEIKIKTL